MHIDGQASRTCILPLSAVIDKDVKTIEGLGTPDSLHRLQQAWLTHNVPQCGYCQPGQLMSASALLEQNPNPTDDDIDQAMSGNLCRCGTYPRIKKAIKDVALAQHKSTSAVSHFDPSVDQRSFSLATNIADTSTVGSIKGDVA